MAERDGEPGREEEVISGGREAAVRRVLNVGIINGSFSSKEMYALSLETSLPDVGEAWALLWKKEPDDLGGAETEVVAGDLLVLVLAALR